MFGQTAILLSVALFALIGSLPRLLEKEVSESECPEPGLGPPGPCTVPFLSHNPLTLHCPGALQHGEDTVYWQYLNLSMGPGPGLGLGLGPGPSLGPGRYRRRPGPGPGPRSGPGLRGATGPTELGEPRTFIGPRGSRARRGPLSELSSRAVLRAGALLVAQARPGDSGLYVCKAGATTLAQYRVDVQDAERLHVSHRGLGQAPLRNQSIRLHQEAGHGHGAGGCHLRLYTRWGPWQECDRCGAPGERKRLGFCWASLQEDEDEEDREGEEGRAEEEPCGLMQLRLGQVLPRRGPEIRYEICRRECGSSGPEELAAQARELLGSGYFLQRDQGLGLGQVGRGDLRVPPTWLQPRSLLLETLLLDVHEEVRLQCPGASVYTPVSWQRDSALLTRLELLRSPCNRSHQLDRETGGGVYTIAGVQRSDQGVYRCWVRGRRAAAFHLELPEPPSSFHDGTGSRQHRLQSRRLLGVLRAVIGSFALVFVLSALAELLHSCWCEVL
ncbi:protein FAM187B-like [Hemiscyllium ocellatum]|uniref:protein FAM187B-like n=1 Tax=Hemiscyllium ocellatum TaxID=170820 RepID=UPI0029674362|nr:protein FAM187B-like [Hemiscyllium ocellatum]